MNYKAYVFKKQLNPSGFFRASFNLKQTSADLWLSFFVFFKIYNFISFNDAVTCLLVPRI